MESARFHRSGIRITLLAIPVAALLMNDFDAREAPLTRHDPPVSAAWSRPSGDVSSLRRGLAEDRLSSRWIYQDPEEVRRRARESGKPVLIVFRCVPCGSAPGLDGLVCTAGGREASEFEEALRTAGRDLDRLLERFVTGRVVRMNGVNRRVFQFDRDLPWAAMVLNADGTVYGRYGTRASRDRKNLAHLRPASFRRFLERSLEIHEAHPDNREALKGKRGTLEGEEFPSDLKTFEPFPEKYQPAGLESCIHCHTVGEAETRALLSPEPRIELRDIFPFPPPGTLGLELVIDDGLEVDSVETGSLAARAGIQTGDSLEALGDQSLISAADVHWALHHAPDSGEIPVVLRRGERRIRTTLPLESGWRRYDSHWRASIAPLRPEIHLRPDPYRVRKGALPGKMGLGVHYPRGAAARAGLRNGDLLVAVDGRDDLHLEGDFLRYLHVDRPRIRSVQLTVIRKGKRQMIDLPIR